jgi:hypothetical protein
MFVRFGKMNHRLVEKRNLIQINYIELDAFKLILSLIFINF